MNTPDSSFYRACQIAIRAISTSPNTRAAYQVDCRHWIAFCQANKIDPAPPNAHAKKDKASRAALLAAVTDWIEEMTTQNVASKTRVRRVTALSSIYNELRRPDPELFNPFSTANGQRRERPIRQRPTPAAQPPSVAKLIAVCAADKTREGLRDEALIRLLWATGMRRSSAASLTVERLLPDGPDAFTAEIVIKGSRLSRVLIRGAAAAALRRHLEGCGIKTGPIFLRPSGRAMIPKDVWRVVRARAKQAGVTVRLSPHSFRASFLTYGEAGLEARQDAAGHADANTTRLYDRHTWRGREAFEKMPEVEDLTGPEKP